MELMQAVAARKIIAREELRGLLARDSMRFFSNASKPLC
jgi:hypothetical protein